jgi:hypothetical protein
MLRRTRKKAGRIGLAIAGCVGLVVALGEFLAWPIEVGAHGKATLRPVGWRPLDDAEAAARVRPWSHEPRPANGAANGTTPRSAELRRFHAAASWGRCERLRRRVTGDFSGTTDEIIQWGAHKWGLDEDVLRAVAVVESNWTQSFRGDIDNGRSYGLMQLKSSVQRGTHPLSERSTAFAVDFYGAGQRFLLEGCATYLGRGYSAGDMWGSVGAWYSGRWHDRRAKSYIRKVRLVLRNRPWEKTGF